MTQQRSPTILNVDENEANRYAISRVLRHAGFEVSEAATGHEALRLAAELPDLIILDIHLSDLDGRDVCQQIRSNVATAAIPVLHVSATQTRGADRAVGHSGGADGFLTQPIDPPELVASVRALLRLRGAEQESRRRAAELMEANHRKDEFLALLAHELRNPLGPIRNALQVLRLRGPDAETLTWAEALIDRQVGHMSRMVDDLLDVSRIGRGKVLIRKERLDLAQTVRATVEDRRGDMENAGLELSIELPPGPVWVAGDPTRLAQVVGNLMNNAIKFTDRGGRITVRVSSGADQGVVAVADTGIGIEPGLLPRVFDTFMQADSSLERSRGGLGLGLALVRGLAELHGGQVHAASDGPGRGAEFTVWLPLDTTDVPVAAVRPTALPQRALRVLMIEDNRDAAESLRLLLQLYGHQVAVAHRGPEGVDAARQWCPDVVLCDLGLPGMDGFAVARALRADPATATICLIAVTGYGSETDQRHSQEAGYDFHLTKPIEPEELKILLGQVKHNR